MIRCVDEYRPAMSMRWRRVKRTAKTLTEAKKIAAKVLAENPQFCPTGAPI